MEKYKNLGTHMHTYVHTYSYDDGSKRVPAFKFDN